MKSLTRNWKIYAIHHSHSDIGYTERQEKIEQYHVDFIRQAVRISNEVEAGRHTEWKGFKWNCETFWAVERFLEQADENEKEQFVLALKRRDLELSGTYLNLSELVDYDILRRKLSAAGLFGRSVGVPVTSAMTADINGYSWGYAQALLDAGIDSLLSNVHTHHGMFPIGRKQTPFYWETSKGERLLVWNGEHYMIGNDLGLNPGMVLSYTIQDEFKEVVGSRDATLQNHWEIAETRIERYLQQLESEDYPYDFVLVNVMGLLRDNASPNGAVAAFINEWNCKHGETVSIEMTTLSRFFSHVRTQTAEIPVYRGDWPDWWTDGVSSTPMHTQIFRDAQRTCGLIRRLDNGAGLVSEQQLLEAEHQLMMYSEHTWGYHSSISEPWHPMVQTLGVRKEAYAANASRLVYTALDQLQYKLGETTLAPGMALRYQVINSFDYQVEDIARIYLENYEIPFFPNGIEVVNEATGEVVIHQREEVSRGNQISIGVRLLPKEKRVFTIRAAATKVGGNTTSSTQLQGKIRIFDLEDLYPGPKTVAQAIRITETGIDSPHVSIRWEMGKGIVSWRETAGGQSLLRTDAAHSAFSPVYEVTIAAPDQQVEERGKMGRNRKGAHVQRSIGRLVQARPIANGPLYGTVELKYETDGMRYYSLLLTVYQELPRVDIAVRMLKDSVWDPENVYISLPFHTNKQNQQLWLDKMGALVRPGIDQLPGTCLDYFALQEGIALLADGEGIVIGVPDTPLLQTGPLTYEGRLLNGQQGEDWDHPLYSWPMTNYWETNFKATLGGFYEFRYYVTWGHNWTSPEQAMRHSHSMNTGLTAFRLKG
ncbi:glycoside hydrolase family 38 N-terminal domain-containing protein [Paenibacillus macquariensis]|uniref:Glycosyl hydrolases family 38 N-terminal domain-containing protein n=1 Tax=Paenibacillus macquariensis TaxID=948756 RepID=A0ABY1KC65_9BACL|nr:glycoside hydrolase [Paenibacillus macquariensis]MEC0089609.1 glycoside hydrolase [Paenibacillus macquariensis]OAB30899.1 glycoside hydrolase [Paenibacillus macquariensis subsp. macquariensis]SIR58351.1 Glycosyl hydrolases family 38 N-terminal domain-containing protein [Paenibacillus macquariensis]